MRSSTTQLLEDMYGTDTSEAEAPAEQSSGSPSPLQLHRSQRTIPETIKVY